jgi:hypothetical protein
MRVPATPPGVTGGPYGGAGQRGNTRRQYIELPVRRLATYGGSGDRDPGKLAIRVRLASSQVRVRIDVNYETAGGQAPFPDITGAGNTIWLAASSDARGGASSSDVPNSSVVGTRATPRPFPSTIDPGTGLPVLDPGLLGFSQEFVTSADWIIGEVVVPPQTVVGTWVLVVTVQPDGVVLPDDAWAEICSLLSLQVQRA